MRRGTALVSSSMLALVLVGLAQARDQGERQVPPMLVFERGGDLYRMGIDGSETVRLTATKAVEADPAASPHGSRLAFTRGASRRRDALWTSDGQGRDQRLIVRARPGRVPYASTSDPAWSPDGRAVYFARAAQGPNEICGRIHRVGADGRGLRALTRGNELDSGPAPSPDGSRIAFSVGECEPGLECCVLSVVDGRGRPTNDLRRLPMTRGGQFSPTWAPDGTRIAFEVADADAGRSGIFVVDRDGSNLRRLTPLALNGEEPAWSPDGDLIAFAAWTRSAGHDLYVVRPDGSGLQRLTRTSADELSPAWFPRS